MSKENETYSSPEREPWQTHDFDRLKQKYLSISEVAKMFDIEEYTLRYWEKETPLQPRRSKSSNARMYEHKDLDLIERIIYLMQVKGLTLQAAATQLENPIVSHDVEILGRLMHLRERLLHLTESIDHLTKKNEYNKALRKTTETD